MSYQQGSHRNPCLGTKQHSNTGKPFCAAYTVGTLYSIECKLMEPTQPIRRNVTSIVKNLKPKLGEYFDKLLRFIPMYVRQVHESSTHGPMVYQTRAYAYIGTFYNFFIRKEVYNLMGEKAFDHRVSEGLKMLADMFNLSRDCESEPEDDDEKECLVDTEEQQKPVPKGAADEFEDDDGQRGCSLKIRRKLSKSVSSDADDESKDDYEVVTLPVIPKRLQKFIESYKKYEDPKNSTINITEDIFNLATVQRILFRDPVQPFHPQLLNMDNIKTVLKHVASFDRSNILINPDVDCEYFNGDANYILDDILLQINTSVRPFRVNDIKCRIHMYQLLLYALGFFLREGKEIRKFKVYNPLLGFEYDYEIPHLDFNEFLSLVQEVIPL